MKKSTTENFIKKAIKVHGDKYDYSKVKYVNNRTKVCIIRPEHGEFWQTPSMHLQGQGCRKCYGNEKMSTETFIEKAKKIHGDKYDYSKVVYTGNKNKIEIICKRHGPFLQRPDMHLQGNGCSKCSYEDAVRRPKKEAEQFIEDAKQIHGEIYDYSKVVYINNKTPVEIICHEKDAFGVEHGSFFQRPDNHLNGQCCPKCKQKISKLEKKIIDFLTKNSIKYEYQKHFPEWLGSMSLDFYLPDFNTVIECQGEQHYEIVPVFGGENALKEGKERDKKKKELCEANGIKVLYYTKKRLREKHILGNCITDLRTLKNILL